MRVGLINFNRKGVRERGIPPVPPIGLEYLVDDLEEDHHEISLADLCFVDREERADVLQEFVKDKDVVGITFRNFGIDSLWLPDEDQFFVPELKTVVGIVREATRAPIVLGGQGYSVYPRQILDYVDADFGVFGPGEQVFRMLLRDLGAHARGTILNGTANRTVLHQRRLIDYDKYAANGGSPAIATKFGCPLSCAYCVEQRRTLQRRELSSIAEEIRLLVSRGTSFLFVAEPEFNNHLRHAIAVCDLIAEHAPALSWTTYLFPVPLTEELIRKMKQAGCVNPCISVVSGSEPVLRELDQRFTADHVRHMAEWCHRYDMPYTVDLLFGGPGETLASAQETIRLMDEIKPAVIGMNLGVRMYGNTPLGQRFRSGRLHANGSVYGHLDGNDDLFRPVYYISDMRVRDYLIEVCQGDSRYRLLGHGQFGGVNYKVAAGEE